MTPEDVHAALAGWATGVAIVTVRDGRDDVGATVSAFCQVSDDPPLVAISLMSGSYPAEVLGRHDAFAADHSRRAAARARGKVRGGRAPQCEAAAR